MRRLRPPVVVSLRRPGGRAALSSKHKATRFGRRVYDVLTDEGIYFHTGLLGLFAIVGAALYHEHPKECDHALEEFKQGRLLFFLKQTDDKLPDDEASVARRAMERNRAIFSELPVLYKAEVTSKMGVVKLRQADVVRGDRGLSNAYRGAEVEVLSESVGRDERFHLCRNEYGEGLYPKKALRRKEATPPPG